MLCDILVGYLKSTGCDKFVGYIYILQFRTLQFSLNRTNDNLN